MTRILTGTYGVGVVLTAALDTPVTVALSGLLNGGLVLNTGGYTQAYIHGTVAGAQKALYLTHGGFVNINGSVQSYYNAGEAVVIAGGRGTVANGGEIRAPNGAGIVLPAGGFVGNDSLIFAYRGIYASGAQTSVTNQGRILSTATAGSAAAVALRAGGTVDNPNGLSPAYNGRIAGYIGVLGQGAAVTVTNGNSISGDMTHAQARGVVLKAGGGVTNLAGAHISGYEGVYGKSHVTVTNAGKIEGNATAGFGVILFNGGAVTNQSGGTVTGNWGVWGGFGGPVTVRNAGTIAGAAYAIRFSSLYNNLLTVDPGAVFSGNVFGGNSTLELASGASAGTISGIGTQFLQFATFNVDNGAAWTLAGTSTLDAPSTLYNAGTLTVSNAVWTDFGTVQNFGVILIDPSTVTLNGLYGAGVTEIGAGSTLTITGGVDASQTIAFLDGTGTLAVDPLLFSGQIHGFAAGDILKLTGVTDASGASIVNGDTLEIQRTGHAAADLTLDPAHDYTGATFAFNAAGVITTSQVPCFLRDTLIRTPRGEVPVQDLVVGEHVATLSGPSRPIIWIGTGRVRVGPGQRSAATPVIVGKGALGLGVRTAICVSPKATRCFWTGC